MFVCLLALLTNWTKFVQNLYEFHRNFTRISHELMRISFNLYDICSLFREWSLHSRSRLLKWCLTHFALSAGALPHVVPRGAATHPHAVHPASSMQVPVEESERSGITVGGRSEASSGAGCGQGAGLEVVIPMPSRDDFGTAHLDPPPGPGHLGGQAAGACLAAECGPRA